jgi:hypothetical protein
LALFWTLGIPLEGTLERDLPALLNVPELLVFAGFAASLYVATAASVFWQASPAHSLFVLPQTMRIGQAILSIAVRSLGAYFVGVPICFAVALWLSRSEINGGDRGVFVWLFAWWMPAWWSIPVGTVLAWRREHRRQIGLSDDGAG